MAPLCTRPSPPVPSPYRTVLGPPLLLARAASAPAPARTQALVVRVTDEHGGLPGAAVSVKGLAVGAGRGVDNSAPFYSVPIE